MLIRKNEIEVHGASELASFVSRFDLAGSVQLQEPILDQAGNILVREKVNLSDSVIKKIIQLEGRHISVLKLALSDLLVQKIGCRLGKEILASAISEEDSCLRHIYRDISSASLSVIENSLASRNLILYAFTLFLSRKDFFSFSSRNGLMTFAPMLKKDVLLPHIRRYAFLTGFLSVTALSDSDIWKTCSDDAEELHSMLKISAQHSARLGIPREIVNALVSADFSGFKAFQKQASGSRRIYSEPDFSYVSDNYDDSYPDLGNESENISCVLRECLKISVFLSFVRKSMEEDGIVQAESSLEKMILSFAYNMEKGIFSRELGAGILESFQEYRTQISNIRRIAEIESKCPFKESYAWAYPKPNPTQILCREKNHRCRNCVSGWEISLFNAVPAFGYIGLSLKPGKYPKCLLEDMLPKHPGTVKAAESKN